MSTKGPMWRSLALEQQLLLQHRHRTLPPWHWQRRGTLDQRLALCRLGRHERRSLAVQRTLCARAVERNDRLQLPLPLLRREPRQLMTRLLAELRVEREVQRRHHERDRSVCAAARDHFLGLGPPVERAHRRDGRAEEEPLAELRLVKRRDVVLPAVDRARFDHS